MVLPEPVSPTTTITNVLAVRPRCELGNIVRLTLVIADDLQKLLTASERRKVLPLLLQRACPRKCTNASGRLQVRRKLRLALIVLFLAILGLLLRLSCKKKS